MTEPERAADAPPAADETLEATRRALARALGETELLNAILVATSGESDLEQLLQTTLDALRRVIPFTGASIALIDGDDLVVRAALGPFADRARGQRLPRPEGAAWRVIETGQVYLSGDVLADGLRPTTGFRSFLAVPLGWRGRRFGLLEVDSTATAAFDAADARLLARVAAVLAGSIELAARVEDEARNGAALAEALADRDRALSELRELERAREEFLAAASHDLRAPLTSIRALAQLARRAVLRQSLPELARLVGWLDQIVVSSGRMTKQITELVDVARLHAGQPLQLERAPVDLVDLVRGAVSEAAAVSERHTIRVEADLDELTGCWDAPRLERVLSNLLSNAIKYSPGGGEILVNVASTADRAVVSVTDRGIGIPAADLSRVFDRFHRGANAAARHEGSGIGLASVRQIVEHHGGTVRVQSREGVGSTFTFELPLDDLTPGSASSG